MSFDPTQWATALAGFTYKAAPATDAFTVTWAIGTDDATFNSWKSTVDAGNDAVWKNIMVQYTPFMLSLKIDGFTHSKQAIVLVSELRGAVAL